MDLRLQSWKVFQRNNQTYLIKFIEDTKLLVIMVTDLQILYKEQLEPFQLNQRCQELNPDLEMSSEYLITHLKETLLDASGHINEDVIKVIEDHNSLRLQLKSSFSGIPFRWEFKMHAEEKTKFREEVTIPMILMISQLQHQQSELFKLLKKKDAEIEDYRQSGGKVSRKYLETQPFTEENFLNKMLTDEILKESVKQCYDYAFSKKSDRCYNALMRTHLLLEAESKEIKSNCVSSGSNDIQPCVAEDMNEDDNFEFSQVKPLDEPKPKKKKKKVNL